MFKTPDGSEVKLQLSSATPQGPVSNKLYATPLSPSITEEVSADNDNALVSTEYDELFAWLLQNKVDDQQIGNYLLLREITLSELVEFENEELQDLVKDIEKESKTKIQMIDKNRLIRACKKLRPQRPISNSIHQHPQPQPQPQYAPNANVHRGSHYQHQPFPPPPQHHQHQHLVNYPATQYNNGYSQTQTQPQPPSHNAVARHMSFGNQQSAYYASPFNPPQPQPTYYNISPQPQSQQPPQPPYIVHQAANNNTAKQDFAQLQMHSQSMINLNSNRNSRNAFNIANIGNIGNVGKGGYTRLGVRNNYNLKAKDNVPLPDEYKSYSRSGVQINQITSSEFTTKDISDLDVHEFDEDKAQIVDHNHLNTKSSNLELGGVNVNVNVEDSQHSTSAYYSHSGDTGIPNHANNVTMIQHNVQIQSSSSSHSNASEDKFEQKVNMLPEEQVQNDALRKISVMSPSLITNDNPSTGSCLQPSVLHHPQVQANDNGNVKQQSVEFKQEDIDDVNNRDSRAISVMTDIPPVQHETIFLQLARFTDKHDLKNELYSVITRLKKEIRGHQQRIDSFSRTLEKLKAKHAKQMDQWNKWYIVELKYLGNEYFNALFKFLSTQIQIEYTYIECFNEKLKSLSKAHNIVATKLEEWKMQKLQIFVKDTIVNVTKMKVSSTTISKKKALENVKQNIGSLQKEYESAKQLLATPKCDHTVRQQTIIYFFNTVTTDYNESNDNLVLTTTYFCEEHLQEKFNSFILDQRCQIHTMYVKNWLINIKKNQEKEKVTIKSIYQFIETLIIKFSKLYKLDQVTQSYYYYVERFAYICIISIPQIHQIFNVLLTGVKGKKEHAKLANKHQYALFCKLLDAKYLSQNQ